MTMIARGTFKGTNAELRAQIEQRMAAFQAALAEHAKTVGAPAPREDDLIEQLVRGGEPFEIEPEPEKTMPPTAEQLAAAELSRKRFDALRALDEQRLAAASLDPNAPQEVKDYEAAKSTTATP